MLPRRGCVFGTPDKHGPPRAIGSIRTRILLWRISCVARLTEKALRAARAGKADRFLWDVELPGFGCRIKPSGVKTFLVQYRVGNRTRRVKVGRWPVMKVERARGSRRIVC